MKRRLVTSRVNTSAGPCRRSMKPSWSMRSSRTASAVGVTLRRCAAKRHPARARYLLLAERTEEPSPHGSHTPRDHGRRVCARKEFMTLRQRPWSASTFPPCCDPPWRGAREHARTRHRRYRTSVDRREHLAARATLNAPLIAEALHGFIDLSHLGEFDERACMEEMTIARAAHACTRMCANSCLSISARVSWPKALSTPASSLHGRRAGRHRICRQAMRSWRAHRRAGDQERGVLSRGSARPFRARGRRSGLAMDQRPR